MNNDKPRNPSAFPFEGGQNNGIQPDSGMTLRDYFAAKAMATLIAQNSYHRGTANADVASNAYWYADAMLAEREREE